MWTTEIAPPLGLQKLGLLAARLGRLATYQLLVRGSVQLKLMGVESATELPVEYKKHIAPSRVKYVIDGDF